MQCNINNYNNNNLNFRAKKLIMNCICLTSTLRQQQTAIINIISRRRLRLHQHINAALSPVIVPFPYQKFWLQLLLRLPLIRCINIFL
ncbi:hypothetical protein ACLKA7_015658 [Drosophila subpalustris]